MITSRITLFAILLSGPQFHDFACTLHFLFDFCIWPLKMFLTSRDSFLKVPTSFPNGYCISRGATIPHFFEQWVHRLETVACSRISHHSPRRSPPPAIPSGRTSPVVARGPPTAVSGLVVYNFFPQFFSEQGLWWLVKIEKIFSPQMTEKFKVFSSQSDIFVFSVVFSSHSQCRNIISKLRKSIHQFWLLPGWLSPTKIASDFFWPKLSCALL